jgi:hypothetical protein
MDIKQHDWWHKAIWERSITSATWVSFRKFLRECFIPSSSVVPCPKYMVTVEVIKQPPKVMHRLEDVGKSIPPLPKAATAVTTLSEEKLATAKISAPCSSSIEVQYVENIQPVVAMHQVNKVKRPDPVGVKSLCLSVLVPRSTH